MTTVANHANTTRAKKVMRSSIRATRRVRDQGPAWRAEVAARIKSQIDDLVIDLAPDAAICAFLPTPMEPDPTLGFANWREWGHDVLLPRMASHSRLSWVLWGPGMTHAMGPFGIQEPVGPSRADSADGLISANVGLILLPGLAAEPAGWRLGQGGGHYDRVLTDLPRFRDGGPLRAVVLHDDEVFAPGAIPREHHDRPVDRIITPGGIVRCG